MARPDHALGAPVPLAEQRMQRQAKQGRQKPKYNDSLSISPLLGLDGYKPCFTPRYRANIRTENIVAKFVSSMVVIEREALLLAIVLEFSIADGRGGLPVSGRKGEYRRNGRLIGYHRFDTSGCPADNSHHA
jgi:hypothetical protein